MRQVDPEAGQVLSRMRNATAAVIPEQYTAVASGWSKRMAATASRSAMLRVCRGVFAHHRGSSLHPVLNRCGTSSPGAGGVTGLALLVRIAPGMPHVSGIPVGCLNLFCCRRDQSGILNRGFEGDARSHGSDCSTDRAPLRAPVGERFLSRVAALPSNSCGQAPYRRYAHTAARSLCGTT